MNYEQREELFESASAAQKHLYESHEAGITLEQISTKHSLQNNHIAFTIAVGDVILGLVPQEKLPELLVERLGITQDAARAVTADVLDFLAPLDAPEAEADKTSVPINATATNDNSLASEIAEAEAAMKTMQPIRTMSHDMEVMRESAKDEPTHTAASQADLLNRSTPNQEAPTDTRWGTEQT